MDSTPIASGSFARHPDRHWEVWPLTFGRARLYLVAGRIDILDEW